MDVANKKVWITGASSGIGLALAKHLSAQGAQLILSSRRTDLLTEIGESLGSGTGKPIVEPIDFSDADGALAKANEIIKRAERVDLLVHAAGLSQRATVMDTGLDVYRTLMEVNYFGLIACTKAVLPNMVQNRTGMIVAISSVAGKVGSQYRSGYSGSKFAVCGFMDCLRAEVAQQGVQCLTVCPGYVKTNIARNALKGDGNPRGESSGQIEGGMTAEICAARIARAIQKNRDEVLIASGQEGWAPLLNRVCPTMLRRIVSKGPC